MPILWRGIRSTLAPADRLASPVQMATNSTAERVVYEPIPEAAKRLIGRPPKYDPSYCQLVILRMQLGYSFGGFAGHIGVGRSQINEWMNKYPEFQEACDRAQAVRLEWWETKAIEVATTGGSGSQGSMVIFGLTNAGREDWKNKQEIEVSGQITLASVVEQSMRQIEAKVIENDPPAASPGRIEDAF